MVEKFSYHEIFNPPIAIPVALVFALAIWVAVRPIFG